MAKRPTTAEILAAARTRDGKRSAAPPASASTALAEPPAKADAVPPAASRPEPSPELTRNGASVGDGGRPPSVESILRQVRGRHDAATAVGNSGPPSVSAMIDAARLATGTDAADAPPSVRAMLDAVRGDAGTVAAGQPRPLSVADALAEVRRICGTAAPQKPAASRPVAEKRTATTAPAAKRATADILAAARRQGGPTAGATKPAAPAADAKPVTSGGARPSTASILAAARRQAGTGEADGEASLRPTTNGTPRPAARAVEPASDLPSVAEMVSALRRLDRRPDAERNGRSRPDGWSGRLRKWFSDSA